MYFKNTKIKKKYEDYYLRDKYRMFFMSPEDKQESQKKKYSLNESNRDVG